jgi:hypothetical protein
MCGITNQAESYSNALHCIREATDSNLVQKTIFLNINFINLTHCLQVYAVRAPVSNFLLLRHCQFIALQFDAVRSETQHR